MALFQKHSGDISLFFADPRLRKFAKENARQARSYKTLPERKHPKGSR